MHVIGWLYDGAVYCAKCIRDTEEDDPHADGSGYSPIFNSTETDSPFYCANHPCGKLIGGRLTREGFILLRDFILSGPYRGGWVEQLMDYYPERRWHFIWTWHGPMNPRHEFQ